MKKIFFISFIAIAACNASRQVATSGNIAAQNYTNGGKVFTALYQQKAAEYRALCLQGYNIAALRIAAFAPATNLPKAIITDIDETILDNSPYAVQQALQGKDFEQQTWLNWTNRGNADTMPGAAALLHYAASRGIEIFYITNRDEKDRAGTMKNLLRFLLPNVDDAHLLLRQSTSSKEMRRQSVMQAHEVVLLMGDNLADFSNVFDKKNTDERRRYTDAAAAQFGNKFIVFPNPNYGDWEGALFNYNYKLTPAQKDSVYRAVLQNTE